MSAVRVVVLRCDGAEVAGGRADLGSGILPFIRCDESFVGDEAEPVAMVRRRARTAGWVRQDGAWDYCPAHGSRSTTPP